MGVCQSKSSNQKESGKNVQDEYKIVCQLVNNSYIVQRWSKVKEASPRQMNLQEVQSGANQDEVNTQEENSQKQDKKYLMKCYVNLSQQQINLIREDIQVHKKLESQGEFYINKIIDVYQWKDSLAIIYEYQNRIEDLKVEITQNKRKIISNVVAAFTFLDKQNDTYHGNICLNNILINKNTLQVKITDFALNRSLYYQNLVNSLNQIFRAPEYEPEVNNLKLQESGIPDKLEMPTVFDDFKKADTWSMGVVLGYLALADNKDYAEVFLKHIKEKQFKDAQALVLMHGEDYGVFFFRLLEIIPKNRLSVAAVNTLLCKFNLKAEIIQITCQKELDYQEYQIRKSQKENISKVHIELQSLLLGQQLGEKLLSLFPKLNLENVTQIHFKIQKNNLCNSGLDYFIKLFEEVSFNNLNILEINFGLNKLEGQVAGEKARQMIENIKAPQLTSFRLYFSINSLGDEGAYQVFDAMTKMPHPYLSKMELGLGQNQLTDQGVIRLGQLLNQLDMMKISGIWIYLGKNKLTYNGVDGFLQNLQQVEQKIISVSEFQFLMNLLTAEEIKQLQEKYQFNSSIRLLF
ncbi:kinase domain protein (macronuclear) [Tetrahymena thermophila SB210]|uniref:Kinase domain protein n=1 Tax=Tetrahymena thermophila (strain SB210) TaxID=312017 RepID=I7LVL2_TETTS|nr:kinase domain protein [Tetrahymena thermophila SB210]EAR98441.2 kinase domain protein [Tetrahymena thermophila SB210]|eukprot:XP_001018686.2 kinase domain protein [Tetrahymena thermophila SB210]